MTANGSCPVCGARSDCRDNPQPVRDFLRGHAVTKELCNPGGREITVDGIDVQLHDMCCNCDLIELRRVLGDAR